MKQMATWVLVAALTGLTTAPALAAPPAAALTTLTIEGAWVPEAPPNAKMMAGYLTLTNRSAAPVTVSGATSPDFTKVTMHQTIKKNGVASMAPVSAVTVPAGGSVRFEPGGYHFMLESPKRPLKAGAKVVLALQFPGGKLQKVLMDVKTRPGQTSDPHGGHDHPAAHDHHH